ncbi:MAG: PEP-CTERM sorting domain-containing protein [Bryobacteraceae bacterium]
MSKRIYFLALLVCAIRTTAIWAGPIDPKIIVSGGGDATYVTSPVFTFMSDSAGGGVLSFINATGMDFLSLDLFVTLAQGSPIDCSSNVFARCEVTSTPIAPPKSGAAALAMFDIGLDEPISGGILNGTPFDINLDDKGSDPNGAGGWGPNNPFVAVANIPEPSSWLLFGGGVALLGGLLRRRQRVHF